MRLFASKLEGTRRNKWTGSWIEDFINELRSESKEFDSWWSMHDIQKGEGVLKIINHPVLGQLKFEFTSYAVISDSNLKLSVLTAIPGSDTEEKIKQYLT